MTVTHHQMISLVLIVYPTRFHTEDVTVFWEERPWLEAIAACKSIGLVMKNGWRDDRTLDYIVGLVKEQNRY